MSLVYFVDDQIEVLEVFSNFLLNDFNVEIFQEPEELLIKLAHGRTPGVVISDLNMPKMNGLDLAKKVRRLNPSIRVILLSGSMDRETSIQACNIGVFSIIEKPINPKLLINTVKRAMEANFLSEKSEDFRRMAADFVAEASALLELYKNRAHDAEAMLKELGLLPQDPSQVNTRLLETSQLQLHVQNLKKELMILNQEVDPETPNFKLLDETRNIE